MKKGIIFILVLMFTVSWAFAEKGAPIQYDPADYPAPTRQGGETVEDATVIESLPYNDAGTTSGYVDDYDEVCPYTGSTSPDVVYSYIPAGDIINGFVSLCGDTDYDSKLYIYENAVTPGAPFACNDDVCTSALGQAYVSELTDLTFIGGNTYYIVVDGYGGGGGNYEIDITGDMSVYGTIEGTVALDGGTGNVEDAVVSTGGVTTNPAADGTYLIEIMVGTYNVTASLAGYESMTIEDVIVTEGNATTGVDFTLPLAPATFDPPQNLMVTDEGYATWEAPSAGGSDEFRYDDGVITAQLGFGANPSSVLGGSHPNNAVIDEVTWYLTSNAVHTEAVIYIFGLQPDGTPDTGQLLHESAALPNVDDAWNTYTLATPITAPDGFFIGVCTPGIFTAIGTDDGVGDPWEFQLGTQWGIADWTAGNEWLDVGPAGFPLNFSIRAYGTDNGDIALAPRNESNVNYANCGLVGSELSVPVNTNLTENRDFLGYNVYLDGDFVDFTTDLFYDYDDGTLIDEQSYLAEVTAVYDEGESNPIDYTFIYDDGVIILDPPVNLAVDESTGLLTWEAPGGGGGDLVELIQHDGNAENAYYQAYDSGYGVVYDLSGYTNVTVEMVDFRHSSWGITGTWDYSIHIVDWDTYTELAEVTGLQSIVNDDWELEIDLGSVSASGLVGIFMEPMGNSAADAYPCIDSDNVGPDGMSYFGPVADYAGMGVSEIGDFLMDLWIMGEATDGVVKAKKFVPNFGNGNARIENIIPEVDFLTLNQTSVIRDLTGYNVYLGTVLQGNTSDLEYLLTGLVNGEEYIAGVSAVYDDGESEIIEVTFTYIGTEGDDIVTVATKLNGNYPNPFNPVTNIDYSIKNAGKVTLEVYNLRGQLVKTLVDEVKETGNHTAIWNGTDNSNKSVSSGVYFYKMISEGNIGRYTSTKKMILLK
jgi:hypothetical protein